MEQSETTRQNQEVLDKVGSWFTDKIAKPHIRNTQKLAKSSSFNINELLQPYLSAFLTGDVTPEGIARTLIYARTLGPSINTSFGTQLQSFITDVLGDAFGSMVPGLDIEFVDQVSGEKRYAQVKLGPNTINKDDVETIDQHFTSIRNLARTNNMKLNHDSLVVGVLYGTVDQLSSHHKALRDKKHHTVLVGADFWHRLTGDPDFQIKLTETIGTSLAAINSDELINETIRKLAADPAIIALSGVKMNPLP